ncbi:MAG: 50S ribosomal protein L21e [Candidatus Bathyarchaeota archaeon]|jgi:large subunit ribosomal protein L21e|nr:50S ribosomal protein L21e [Candidatus Bathyarchaeota archaeon]
MKARGFRHRTRSLLRRRVRERGKTGLSKVLREYALGDRVLVRINPSIHKGMPHRRFHGKIGVVGERRGRAYVVNVSQGNAVKEIIVRPEHLEPVKA